MTMDPHTELSGIDGGCDFQQNTSATPCCDLSQQLQLENACLRKIIGELLVKNQKLRWAAEGRIVEPGRRPTALETSASSAAS